MLDIPISALTSLQLRTTLADRIKMDSIPVLSVATQYSRESSIRLHVLYKEGRNLLSSTTALHSISPANFASNSKV